MIYSTGSITIKIGSASVKGDTGTEDFVTYAAAGYLIKPTNESTFYEIGAINSATRLTLTSRYSNSLYRTARSENVATMTATQLSSGTLDYNPVLQNYVTINASVEKFSDNGAGILVGNASGTGTVDYDTGVWTITLGTTLATEIVVSASYLSGDTRTAVGYQIVTDYTPNNNFPEMALSDANLPHIYTKGVRLIDNLINEDRVRIAEVTATPTEELGYGKLFVKDNKLYYQAYSANATIYSIDMTAI